MMVKGQFVLSNIMSKCLCKSLAQIMSLLKVNNDLSEKITYYACLEGFELNVIFH